MHNGCDFNGPVSGSLAPTWCPSGSRQEDSAQGTETSRWAALSCGRSGRLGTGGPFPSHKPPAAQVHVAELGGDRGNAISSKGMLMPRGRFPTRSRISRGEGSTSGVCNESSPRGAGDGAGQRHQDRNLLGQHAGEGDEDHVEENHENSEATIVPRDLNARGGWIVVSGRRTREGDA